MLPDALKETIRQLWPQAVALSDDLHDHPELGHEEFHASQTMVDLLRKAGYQVEYPYLDYPTGFRGVLKTGEGPSVALLVEYDALPVVGHACGHNVHGYAAKNKHSPRTYVYITRAIYQLYAFKLWTTMDSTS